MPKTLSIAVLVALVAAGLQAQDVQIRKSGPRVLSATPPVGVHPRIFFTKQEIPAIRERLASKRFGVAFRPVLDSAIKSVKNKWKTFSELDFSSPTDEQMVTYVRPGEGRNINWGMASLYAILYDDKDLRDIMCRVIANYGRLLLASRERALAGNGFERHKQFSFWRNSRYDVGVSWTLGASGYAVSYDVLYNFMKPVQRDVVRAAIAAGTKGRKPYGTGMPRGFAASNHYGYHGDLAVLLCAIEGEADFDQATFDGIRRVLYDYWDVGFTAGGACHEDGYGPNLGLRGGGRGLMALARRDRNIFATAKFRNFIDWFALEYEPFPCGTFIGGASGANYKELYPTSTVLIRYMYPELPAANFCYRHLVGDEYDRRFRWQGLLDFMMFGGDWKGPQSREAMLKAAGLRLVNYFPVRGKWMARSDWSEEALCLTLDSRPDAFMIGHDKVDRGHFTLSALGRMWAYIGDFHHWNESRENSLLHIDGKAQGWKAPGGLFVWQRVDGSTAAACADLTYAYNWQWSPPWPKVGETPPADWEREKSSPVELGWPKDAASDWLPDEIYGSDTGYAHRNGLLRRPYNRVKKAYRAVLLQRGKQPYVVIADELAKADGETHLYEWIMQVPTDLVVVARKDRGIVLGEPAKAAQGAVWLLVSVVRAENANGKTPERIKIKLERFTAGEDKKGEKFEGARLIVSVESKDPHFRVLLLPFREGDRLPEAESRGDTIEISRPDRTVVHTIREVQGRGIEITKDASPAFR